MTKRGRALAVLLAAAALVALAAVALRNRFQPGEDDAESQVSEERLCKLRLRIEREAAAVDATVEAYRPKVAGRLDDLTSPAEDLLRGLPGVAEVERLVTPKKPTRRIVHLRDLHLVPRDLFALDVRQAAGKELSDAHVDRQYEQHLLETELVQIEQTAILRCLARHHGLRKVRLEGLTLREVPLFREKVEALKGLEHGEVASARVQLREVRALMRGMEAAGRKGTDRYEKAAGIEKELVALLEKSRPHLLEIGAAGRLLLAGDLAEVLALDDERLLEAARPITPNGRLKIDADRVRQREDAQVRATLADAPFSLIVLGGGHDLSYSIRRVAGGECEYIRVTTKWYREFGQ
jgi:hypothetical protein